MVDANAKYWISEGQIKTLSEYAHLEDEAEINKLLKKVQEKQKINK